MSGGLTAARPRSRGFPRWSPDGQTIAFNRKPTKGPGGNENIWLMEADGANPRLLIEQAGLPAWMPGGRALVFLSFKDGQLHIFDLATKGARPLAQEQAFGAGMPTSDGGWLAYMSIASGSVDIHTVPAAGGAPRPAVATPRQDFHPSFSPSGRWLYFQLDHRNLYRVPGPAQGWRPAAPEKVTNFPGSGLFLEDPQISRAGRQLMYSRRRATGDIWVMSFGR